MSAEAVALLTLILAELRKLNASSAKSGGSPVAAVASDADLDGQYGDPEVKKDPPRWGGKPYGGRGLHYSQTEPAFLEVLASFKDWSASKDDELGAVDAKGRPKSHWSRKDASLARGWAARLRAGWKPAENRYGTSGYGASAKHTGTPESDDFDQPYDGQF